MRCSGPKKDYSMGGAQGGLDSLFDDMEVWMWNFLNLLSNKKCFRSSLRGGVHYFEKFLNPAYHLIKWPLIYLPSKNYSTIASNTSITSPSTTKKTTHPRQRERSLVPSIRGQVKQFFTPCALYCLSPTPKHNNNNNRNSNYCTHTKT